MSVKLLQVNLNHACQAQHLFCHGLDERDIGLAFVAEPYRIPENNPNWVGDECGSAAIVKNATFKFPPLQIIGKGRGFVAVRWGSTVCVACMPPSQVEPQRVLRLPGADRGDSSTCRPESAP
ncbi:hypothetical protein CAJAP_00843 [Camponotus japonicus]